MIRFLPGFHQLRNQAVKTKAAVVGRDLDFGSGRVEIVDPGQQIGRAYAVTKRNPRCGAPGRPAAIAPLAQQLPGISEKGRLADATRDQPDVVDSCQLGKSIAERSPYFHFLATIEKREPTGQLSHDEVNN